MQQGESTHGERLARNDGFRNVLTKEQAENCANVRTNVVGIICGGKSFQTDRVARKPLQMASLQQRSLQLDTMVQHILFALVDSNTSTGIDAGTGQVIYTY